MSQSLPSFRFFPRVILAFAFAGSSLFAQTAGKVSGVIRDAQTKEPLIGANVVIVGTSLGAATDLEGGYFILNVPAGKYDLQASMLGYQRVVQRDVIVNSGRTTNADFNLSTTTIEQREVVIEATRPDVEREKTSTSVIIRADDVGSIAGMRDVNDVIGLAADVTDGHFRGGRSNEEYYTLQGMGIVNPLDASAAFRPIVSAVEEIEVITSGFDAQYGNAQSGVVNITMKEGKRDKWNSRFEVRMRAPGKQYFGPSVFDESAQPYLQKLADPNFWRYGDATTSYQGIVGIFNSQNFGLVADTALLVQSAMQMWKSASSRDLNTKYWLKQIDYSVEGATGGPLDDGVTMFLALRSQVENPIVPTEEPDKQQQVMGNLAFDLGSAATLRLSGGYQYQFNNVLGSGTGFYQWMWDRILGQSYRKRTNLQLGARFTQSVSSSTFYEIKLNTLTTTNRQGTSPWYDTVTDAVRNMETGSAIITRTMNFLFSAPTFNGKTFFYLGNNLSNFTNEKTSTISLDASFTSQMTKSHLVNAGVQANYYSLSSDNIGSIASRGNITVRNFKGNPYELGLYLQDKMEFEGMIAKVGLRWDLWDSNNEYYQDQFDPFVVLDANGNPTSTKNPDLAPKVETKPIGRLQPRFGVSFPVSITTVFHLNYGTFMQRPSFQYVIGDQRRMPPVPNPPTVNSLSNPRIKPQVTNSYDIGLTQGLGEGFTLDISGYYKDIKDLVEQAVYTNLKSGTSYFSYVNRDYADVRGFRIALTKRRGMLTGSLNYQFSVATGKSASASNAPITVTYDPNTGEVSTDAKTQVPIRDVLLNFDRTHNLILTLACVTDEDFAPFDDMVFSVNTFARSGRPYTDPDNLNDVNGLRSPAEYNTNLRVSKRIGGFLGLNTTVYMEVFNLFNNKIFNYNYLFATANKIDQPFATAAYKHYALDDLAHGALYIDDQNLDNSPYPVDHSFLLYDNSPRSFNFGIAIDF
ncbi:MAG: carboxypeptidase-like regulatory domain-containing protein [Bacteroidota bacterium]